MLNVGVCLIKAALSSAVASSFGDLCKSKTLPEITARCRAVLWKNVIKYAEFKSPEKRHILSQNQHLSARVLSLIKKEQLS